MPSVLHILKQDFKAIEAAFVSRDYELMNIFSNRLMSNALFGSSGNGIYALPGFFLKELSIKASQFAPDSTSVESIRLSGNKLIRVLDEAFTEDLQAPAMWQAYFDFVDTTRTVETSKIELDVYEKDPDFTSDVVTYLIKDFLTLELICEEKARVLKGVLNEINRLVRAHGIHKTDLPSWCLIIKLDRIYDYHFFSCRSLRDEVDKGCLEKRVAPFVERIRTFHESERGQDTDYSKASEILCNFIFEWRRAFIKYLEGRSTVQAEEKRLELPEDAKKRISETIAEALRKDVESGEKPSKKGRGKR